MPGAWSFVASASGGTLRFDSGGFVSGITQNGACSGFALVNSNDVDYSSYPVIIKYTVRCGDGKTYPYTLSLSPVGGDCSKLSGTKVGNYSGGHTENIVLQKQ